MAYALTFKVKGRPLRRLFRLGALAVVPMLIAGGGAQAGRLSATDDQGGAQQATPLQPRLVADDLAQKVERLYLLPRVAALYAAMLRKNAAAGLYDGISSRTRLATRLTADLQALAPDRHLRLLAGGASAPDAAASTVPAAPASYPVNGWVAPGVAYLRMANMLYRPDELIGLSQFMQEHEGAHALILDLRGNPGGTLEPMDAILPWLYRTPTLLMRMESRATAGPPPQSYLGSTTPLPTQSGMRRYDQWVYPHRPASLLAGAQVYVLTSAATLSAAEQLALALQHSRRAQIIGERTGGASHFGPLVGLVDDFTAFIPVGQSYLATADKGQNIAGRESRGWENTGIVPDVAVPADLALEKAIAMATNALADSLAEQSGDQSLSLNPATGLAKPEGKGESDGDTLPE